MTEWRIYPEDWPDAIARIDGPQIIVAGPGTGKTEFLVRRFIELTGERSVPAEHIGMLTFSRRAASDLKRRVLSHLDRSTTQVPASTFHSLAFRLLERHGQAAMGWEEMPSLLTGPEQVSMVAGLLSSEDPGKWPVLFRPLLESVTFAEEVADFIMRSREHLLRYADLLLVAEGRDEMVLEDRALDALISHPWPGNVRQLENSIEYAFARCKGDVLTLKLLPPDIRGRAFRREEPRGGGEEQRVRAALDANQWHHGRAARELGMARTTLWRKMKRLGLRPER